MKKVCNWLSLSPSRKFVIVHSSTMNPCIYSVLVLKGQGFQEKQYTRSFANFVHRKAKTMTFKALPKISEDILLEFKNSPLLELYNIIYVTMYLDEFKVNKDG